MTNAPRKCGLHKRCEVGGSLPSFLGKHWEGMSIRTLVPGARLFIHWQHISSFGCFLLQWDWPAWDSKVLLIFPLGCGASTGGNGYFRHKEEIFSFRPPTNMWLKWPAHCSQLNKLCDQRWKGGKMKEQTLICTYLWVFPLPTLSTIIAFSFLARRKGSRGR